MSELTYLWIIIFYYETPVSLKFLVQSPVVHISQVSLYIEHERFGCHVHSCGKSELKEVKFQNSQLQEDSYLVQDKDESGVKEKMGSETNHNPQVP